MRQCNHVSRMTMRPRRPGSVPGIQRRRRSRTYRRRKVKRPRQSLACLRLQARQVRPRPVHQQPARAIKFISASISLSCRLMLLAFLSASSAWAQQRAFDILVEDASESSLETIIVTAEKRSEALKDVPMSVTAISGSELTRTQATRSEDYICQ